jgi:hypothetical protein
MGKTRTIELTDEQRTALENGYRKGKKPGIWLSLPNGSLEKREPLVGPNRRDTGLLQGGH